MGHEGSDDGARMSPRQTGRGVIDSIIKAIFSLNAEAAEFLQIQQASSGATMSANAEA